MVGNPVSDFLAVEVTGCVSVITVGHSLKKGRTCSKELIAPEGAQVRIVWKHYLVLVQNSIVQGGDPLYAGLLYNRALEAILVHNERIFLK